jgi:hypothetical protein
MNKELVLICVISLILSFLLLAAVIQLPITWLSLLVLAVFTLLSGKIVIDMLRYKGILK